MKQVYKELEFNSKPIRALMGSNGAIYLCAWDICVAMKRPTLMKGEPIFHICKSACQIKFNPNDRAVWAILPSDIKHLFRFVQNDSKAMHEMCKKLFAWAENVRSVFCPEPTVDLPNTEGKAEEVVVYKYNSLPITFESADGRIMVNATQMVAPFKKTVRDWTRLKSTQDFLEALSTDKHICLSLLINTIKGGNGEQGTWMQEDVALEFARWINPLFGIWCNDRIRELLKHGITATPDTIEKMLSNPDFAIGVFSKLKEERAAKEKAIEERLAAEQKAISLEEEVGYKEAVIEGLVKEIPLADLRQRICDIVRKRGGNAKLSWSILYEEFGKKFHINVKTRMKRRKFIGNTIDFIEKELKMLPELYELTCKLFESEYDQLISDWGRFAQDVQNTKIK